MTKQLFMCEPHTMFGSNRNKSTSNCPLCGAWFTAVQDNDCDYAVYHCSSCDRFFDRNGAVSTARVLEIFPDDCRLNAYRDS